MVFIVYFQMVVVRHIDGKSPRPTKHYKNAVHHNHARSPQALRRYLHQAKSTVARIMVSFLNDVQCLHKCFVSKF